MSIFYRATCEDYAHWCINVDHGSERHRMKMIGDLLLKLAHVDEMALRDHGPHEMIRGVLDCPFSEPLHHDKDGCPECTFMDPATPESVIDAKARGMAIDPDALAARGTTLIASWLRGVADGGKDKA